MSLNTPQQGEQVLEPPLGRADQPTHEVLVVDADRTVRRSIGQAVGGGPRRVHEAASIADARRIIRDRAIDLALIDDALPDGSGLELAKELGKATPASRSIMLADHATAEGAIAAMRAGARDLIAKPLDAEQLKQCVVAALKDVSRDQRRRRRVTQLRKLCRQLNSARHEISQQVDILCHDLVSAYQELASQVHCIEQTAELRTTLASELDLEQVLRHVMQFLLDKLGPSNVIVFLPAPGAGYTVGGYVNYSFNNESIKAATGHLADTAAPIVADHGGLVQLDDDESIHDWFGDGAGWITGSALLAMPCLDSEGESLATLMLFRSSDAAFDEAGAALLEAAGPIIANHLARVVRVHNRHHDLFDDEDEDRHDPGFDSLPF